MPARSKRQHRFMHAVASGAAKAPSGLSRAQAGEYVKGQSPKGLPESAAASAIRKAVKRKKGHGRR